ncbi:MULTISPECIES: LLM class flavin-dependent oxidoreductase [Parafrankia]|uniref:LLM class flavin-dependent oxidoreductase n=1 Tax=Parafrankia TaxID=2994362 RepID=UPI0034D3E22B
MSEVAGPPVTVGVFLVAAQFPGVSQAETLAAAAAYAVAAEHAGLHGVWIAEHHFISYGLCPSAITFAAHVLGSTRRIEVGTAACVLSTRHPVALGEETALLDHISGGRFRLGVARGGPWLELEVFGTGLPRYERGFAEALDLLLRWLDSERVAADGEFFAFRETPVVPRMRTEPRPPVWVAATSIATVELAAVRGVPLLLGLHQDDMGKARLLAHYDQVATRGGRDPRSVPHCAVVVAQVADSRAEAAVALRAAMPGWITRGTSDYTRIDGVSAPGRDADAYVEHLLRIHPVGTPEQCARRLADTVERTGVRRLLLMVEGSGNERGTLDNIARLGTEVLPLLGASGQTLHQ